MHYGEIFLPLELGLLKKYDSLDMAPTRTFEVPILIQYFLHAVQLDSSGISNFNEAKQS